MKAALLQLLLIASVSLAGCSAPLERFTFDHPAMGTRFRLLLYADDAAHAQAAADAAFARVDELERLLSDWQSDSELSRVGRAANAAPGTPIAIGPDLARVAARAQELSAVSEGAFDITVGPLVQLWRRAHRQGVEPDAAALARARAATGFELLTVDRDARTLTFAVAGMALDLGAIAKGDALDQALAVVTERGFPRALLVGGGDLRAGDPPPDRDGWRIELSDFSDDDAAPAPSPRLTLQLANAALATSGDRFRWSEVAGERRSHVIDPKAGLGLTRRGLATVVARDGATADALATACGVAGPERAAAIVGRVLGAASRLLTLEEGAVRACASPGWPPMMPLPVEARGEDDVDPFADPP